MGRLRKVRVSAGIALIGLVGCRGLPTFEADLGKQMHGDREIRIPYTSLTSYFGYVAPGGAPDDLRDGRKLFYLYVWVPGVAPELGVRMISPVAGVARPTAHDFVDNDFPSNANDDTYFDTWLRVERCLTVTRLEELGRPCSQWASFGDNDDSPDLPPQPSGEFANSLLRIRSSASDPLHALARGLYRIAFTSSKAGEVQGTFLAQVGAPVDLPGTAIARTPADLRALLQPPSALP
jgi:hypothetical protein